MRLPIVLLLLLLVAGCSDTKIEAAIEESAKGDFVNLPGAILISVRSEGKTIRYAIRASSVEPTSQVVQVTRESHASILPYGATMLPDRPGGRYKGPYAFTADKRYVAASFVSNKEEIPTSLAIFDWVSKQEVAEIRGTKEEAIYAVAWSPDSRFLAVLRKSYRKGRFSLGNLISAISGHPERSETYYLETYGLSGTLTARSRLVADVPQSAAELAWVR
jgi:hypothetical protein